MDEVTVKPGAVVIAAADDAPATGRPEPGNRKAMPLLEQMALQELAAARPMPEAVDSAYDALTACISWDLESPHR